MEDLVGKEELLVVEFEGFPLVELGGPSVEEDESVDWADGRKEGFIVDVEYFFN